MKILKKKEWGHLLPLLIVLLFNFYSCNKKISYKTIDKVLISDSIYVDKQTNFSSARAIDFLYEQDMPLLATILSNSYYCDSAITVYNIKSNTIAYRIPLPFTNMKGIVNPMFIKAFNSDSILIVYDSNHIGYDSSIVIINKKGKIIKNFKVQSDYIKTSENNNPHVSLFPMINTNDVFKNNKICFTLRQYSRDTLLPIAGYYDLKKEKFVVCENLKLKMKNENCYNSFIDTNIICISPLKSDSIYLWNITNNSISTIEFKSKLVDNAQIKRVIPFFNNEKESIIYLDVNKYYALNYYTRFVILPENVFGNNIAIQILYDNEFNYIGEVLINNNDTKLSLKNSLSDKENIWNQYKIILSENENKIKIAKIDYIFKYLDLINTKKSLNDSLLHYVKLKNKEFNCFLGNNKNLSQYSVDNLFKYIRNKLIIKDTSFSIFFLRLDGCYHCNDYIYDFFNKFRYLLSNKYNTYITIYNPNSSDNLTYKNFRSLNSEHVLFDNAVYPVVHPYKFNNPRLLIVDKNKIILDTIYMPDDMNKMLENYLKYNHFDFFYE